MRSTYAGFALVALAAAKPVPQSSSSCSGDYSGEFKIQVVKTSGKVKRQDDNTALVMTLSGGVLTDSEGRTGYIASNHQFQFDAPVQAGALQQDDFNVCGGYLAHGDDTTWDQCLSGNFYNLYDDNSIAAGNPGQCEEINIQVIGGGSSAAPATTSVPVTVISDGQPQASTAVPAPVTQISDGQIQATTATPVAPVTQIGDGQPQAPTSTAPVAPVTQISDGQIQAPTSTAVAPCTQIVDGQPQCPTTTAPYPSGTGSVIMPTGTGVMPTSSYAPIPATGSGSTYAAGGSIFGVVAAVAALMF